MKSLAITLAVLTASFAVPAFAAGDWNDGQIGWMSYDSGLEAAAKQGKPICLVFYTDWCGHCKNYSGVFHDPDVVERSKRFVMVRLNKDQNAELSAKYAVDGEYIPRTYFLSSSGELDAELQAPREDFRYFYHETDPSSLLAGMDRALTKLAAAP